MGCCLGLIKVPAQDVMYGILQHVRISVYFQFMSYISESHGHGSLYGTSIAGIQVGEVHKVS